MRDVGGNKRKNKKMITLHQEKDELTEYLINCFQNFVNKKGNPKAVGISLYESIKKIQIHFNLEKELDKNNKTANQFEYKNEYETSYQMGKPDERGFIYDMRMWRGIRNATKKVELPTVLCCFDDETKNYLAIESELELFGRAVVKFFREEPMEFHESNMKRYTEKSVKEITANIPEHWTEELRNKEIESAQFFNSLNLSQKEYLNRYVKKMIDFTSFIVMRAIDENTGFKDSDVNIEIRGIEAKELPLIGNGNLSGEYFDWIERFSKYGEYEI